MVAEEKESGKIIEKRDMWGRMRRRKKRLIEIERERERGWGQKRKEMEREKIGRIREMERRNTVMRLKWEKIN